MHRIARGHECETGPHVAPRTITFFSGCVRNSTKVWIYLDGAGRVSSVCRCAP